METIEKLYFMVAFLILNSVSHVEGYRRYYRSYYYYSNDGISIGAIVGIVIGGLFVIGITITFIAALCGALCFSKRSHRSVTSVPSNNIAVVTAHPGYPQMQPMNHQFYGPANQFPPPPAYYESQNQTLPMGTNAFQTPSAPRPDRHNSESANPFLTTTNFGNYKR
ncbi:uncharacterized protein LOC143072282 [Mytilus galloprovincialis]|uniref:uncharacterized protein LOC143072282 n=1 Tax=Mytilus galloprovincialis TaxID=29158 RepID=UPI003F7C4FC0